MAQSTGYQAHDTSRTKEAASDLKERATEGIERMARQAEGAARAVGEQGREMTEQVQVVAENFKTALDKSIREQPVTTLALTAAVAFVIGALWKS
jgi:ElaB/YqjD/DUF883 family membrane-anchored ribosome-binding protein